jgi:hypothetical protein
MLEREPSNLPNLSRRMTHVPPATVFALAPNETCQFGNASTAANWGSSSRNPLLRFRREYFWEDIALLLKRCTGITLGVHRNYRRIDR